MAKYKRVKTRLIFLLISLAILTFFYFTFFCENYIADFVIVKSFDFNQTKQETIYPERSRYKIGEKLKYGIYSTGIRVGSATITYNGLTNIDGQMLDCVILEATAPGFRDVERIYGRIENFSPVKVERDIGLFGEDIEITEKYNQETNEVSIIRKAKETTTQNISSENRIGNVILLLYNFRYGNRLYAIGDKIEFNLPTKKLLMRVEEKVNLKVPMGKFEAFFVKSEPARFKVWFNSQEDRIPLRIQGAIGFGNTYLSLIEIEESN